MKKIIAIVLAAFMTVGIFAEMPDVKVDFNLYEMQKDFFDSFDKSTEDFFEHKTQEEMLEEMDKALDKTESIFDRLIKKVKELVPTKSE